MDKHNSQLFAGYDESLFDNFHIIEVETFRYLEILKILKVT
jgi:hypothetical protein